MIFLSKGLTPRLKFPGLQPELIPRSQVELDPNVKISVKDTQLKDGKVILKLAH